MPFFCNFTSKGCSGALILGKQVTHKSEWAHKRSWEINQHNSNNSEQCRSHILKQFAFSLTSNKTKLPSENAMLWQNPNLLGVSSCLNWRKFSVDSLAKAKNGIDSKERFLLNYGKHKVCLKMRFSCKISSKDSSRALTKPKQMTHSSKWVHKPHWKISEHKCTNSEIQSPGNGAFLQTHNKKRSLGQIKRLLYKSSWARNHVMKHLSQSHVTLNPSRSQKSPPFACRNRYGYMPASATLYQKWSFGRMQKLRRENNWT